HGSPDRVTPPCRYAGPGGCGGCDWQHASLEAQRRLKAAVIRQQLSRIAGLDTQVAVMPMPGDSSGLGWRTVVSFAIDRDGTAGLRRHRSHEIVGIDQCLIAHSEVTAAGITANKWPGARSVQIAIDPDTGEQAVLVAGPAVRRASLPDVAADSVQILTEQGRLGPVRGRGFLTRHAAGRDWRVSAGGFWQVHQAAADALGRAVLAALNPQPGEVALDLYCGAGLFAGLLAEAVGPDGAVLAVEQDRDAVRMARHNLRRWEWARVHRGDAADVLARTGLSNASIAVLDPPRTGASRRVIDVLGDPSARLRRLAYLSCDPATLARDLRLLLDSGWELTDLQGYDAFPMTHHVECLAVLDRRPR
ncbi:MAG: class I SAM-dependent RNA methyltransferase, partial [Actinobacteria bacterium]|nr:class I SAM-dependent RNA methyltransferase [Actinomycetota bacterium]